MTEKKIRIFLNKDYSTEKHFVPKDTELKKSVRLISNWPPWDEYRLVDLEGKFVRSYPYDEIFGNSFFRIIERYCDCGINCDCFKGMPALHKEIEKVFLARDYSTEECFMPKNTELKRSIDFQNVFRLYNINGLIVKAFDMNEHLDNSMFRIIFKEPKYFEITIPSLETLKKGYVYKGKNNEHFTALKKEKDFIEYYKSGNWFPDVNKADNAIKYMQCKVYVNQLIEYCQKNRHNRIEPHIYLIEIGSLTKEMRYVKYERSKYNATLFRKPVFNNKDIATLFIEKFDPKFIQIFYDMIYEEKLI